MPIRASFPSFPAPIPALVVAVAAALSLIGHPARVHAEGEAKAPAAPAKKPPRLVVETLEARGFDAGLAAVLTDAVCGALFDARKDLHTLCPDDVRTLLAHRQAELQMGGDSKAVSDTMRLLQARFTLSGSVSRLGDQAVVSLTLIDLKEGAPISRATRMATVGNREAAGPVLEALQGALTDLMDRVPAVAPEGG